MKREQKIINKIRQRILPILKQHEVKRAALFGSCIRGGMKKNSDVDILIDIKKEASLLDFIELKLDLEKALKKKVDLVEYDTIKTTLKNRILGEQVRVL